MLCAPANYVIDRLNSLLRVELAAVAGYQKALRTLKKKALAHTDHILRLAAEHQRTVTALHGSVQARGGAPVVTADPWEGSSAAALPAAAASMMLEDKEFMGALLELELIPRQRRHVAGLSAMLVHLAA